MQDFESYVPFIASYQMFGDSEGKEWMTEVLSHEMEKEGESVISGFSVHSSTRGVFGIQFIVFEVQVPARVFLDANISNREVAADWIKERINGIVGDSDVEILWTGSLVGELEVSGS